MSDDESTSSFEESGHDSDKELQEAFAKGLLKPGLNKVQEVVKRQPINNVTGLNAKLDDFRKQLDWFERLDVTSERELEKGESATDKREDDFKRECSFYRQAQLAVLEAIPKLHQQGVVTQRPNDYYAEMAKSDDHMKKVREKLVSVQAAKERSEMARKLRQERKFAVQIQRDVLKERQSEKKMLSEAVKKHKKGFKDQLRDVLENRTSKGSQGGSKRAAQKKAFKDSKFGFGGRKKRSKSNTAESSANAFGFGTASKSGGGGKKGGGKGTGGKGGKKKQNRPGKSKRKAKHGKGRS